MLGRQELMKGTELIGNHHGYTNPDLWMLSVSSTDEAQRKSTGYRDVSLWWIEGVSRLERIRIILGAD